MKIAHDMTSSEKLQRFIEIVSDSGPYCLSAEDIECLRYGAEALSEREVK